MYPATRIFLKDDNGDKFFGEGPCRLLKGIERTGSLRAAAQEMDMAYTKALHLIKHAEEVLGFPLTQKSIGGKGGGGSQLTPKARDFLQKYETYRDACYRANAEIYRQIFPSGEAGEHSAPTLGCVLMASGLGERFGGNKLLASFGGEPLIRKILEATDTPLFQQRIVVTRHPEVAELCRAAGIRTILHSLPDRSDTIRLGLEALAGNLPDSRPELSDGCRNLSDSRSELSDSCLDLPDGCMFCTCDQPFLSRETIERMAQAFLKQPEAIYRLSYGGVPGSPLIFPKKYFPELKNLPQGRGGSYAAASHPEQICLLEASSPWELRDIDTREDLQLLEKVFLKPAP